MRKIVNSILLAVLLVGCSSGAGVDEKNVAVSKGKISFNTLSEIKSAKAKDTDSLLKSVSKLYTVNETKSDFKISKIEIGEEVSYIYYTGKDKKMEFSIQQQRFADIKTAYKDTINRMENSVEKEIDGVVFTVGRPGSVVLVATVKDNYLINLVLPEDMNDEEIVKILKSIDTESL